MTKVRAPVKCGQLGKLAGVKGAAYGASFQLKMRDDLRKVRAAVDLAYARAYPALASKYAVHVCQVVDGITDFSGVL